MGSHQRVRIEDAELSFSDKREQRGDLREQRHFQDKNRDTNNRDNRSNNNNRDNRDNNNNRDKSLTTKTTKNLMDSSFIRRPKNSLKPDKAHLDLKELKELKLKALSNTLTKEEEKRLREAEERKQKAFEVIKETKRVLMMSTAESLEEEKKKAESMRIKKRPSLREFGVDES